MAATIASSDRDCFPDGRILPDTWMRYIDKECAVEDDIIEREQERQYSNTRQDRAVLALWWDDDDWEDDFLDNLASTRHIIEEEDQEDRIDPRDIVTDNRTDEELGICACCGKIH